MRDAIQRPEKEQAVIRSGGTPLRGARDGFEPWFSRRIRRFADEVLLDLPNRRSLPSVTIGAVDGGVRPARMNAALGARDVEVGESAGLARRHGPGLLQSKALVLNRSFLPVHVTSVRRALVLLYRGVARAVDESYQTFDFRNWCELTGIQAGGETLGLVGRTMPVPRVILLSSYDRVPRRHVRFTRQNVYSRDRDTCQYCARRFPRSELNLDHVIPRSQGGASSWENVVCSCHACNRRKGGYTPEQSGLRLIRRPTRPAWTPFLADAVSRGRYREWRPFLGFVDPVRENGSN